LDGRAQVLVVNRPGKAAGEPYGRLLEGHDLEAMTTVASRRQAAFPHGETTVNDQSGSTRDGHGRSPSGSYFLFGRWTSVEARPRIVLLHVSPPTRVPIIVDRCRKWG
jgi:hypothetical protein